MSALHTDKNLDAFISKGLTAMPMSRKVWAKSPAKSTKPSVPDFIKAQLTIKATHLIENILKPKHVQPPQANAQLNYITDISATWIRHYFYLIAHYACPSPSAMIPTFESKFARMAYVGDGKFALAFLRHTGAWVEIYDAQSVDECLQAIHVDQWFTT